MSKSVVQFIVKVYTSISYLNGDFCKKIIMKFHCIIGASLSDPHTSESALKYLYVCTYVATYRKCFLPILHVLEIRISYSSSVDKHKIARDSSNAEQLS